MLIGKATSSNRSIEVRMASGLAAPEMVASEMLPMLPSTMVWDGRGEHERGLEDAVRIRAVLLEERGADGSVDERLRKPAGHRYDTERREQPDDTTVEAKGKPSVTKGPAPEPQQQAKKPIHDHEGGGCADQSEDPDDGTEIAVAARTAQRSLSGVVPVRPGGRRARRDSSSAGRAGDRHEEQGRRDPRSHGWTGNPTVARKSPAIRDRNRTWWR